MRTSIFKEHRITLIFGKIASLPNLNVRINKNKLIYLYFSGRFISLLLYRNCKKQKFGFYHYLFIPEIHFCFIMLYLKFYSPLTALAGLIQDFDFIHILLCITYFLVLTRDVCYILVNTLFRGRILSRYSDRVRVIKKKSLKDKKRMNLY